MSDYLGGEVVTGILSRLPVKSLIRFMCVSKSWCSLFSSPYFISSHLRNSQNNNKNTQMLVHQSEFVTLFDARAPPTPSHLFHLDDPQVNTRYQSLLLNVRLESPDCNLYTVGSAGGLICFAAVQGNQFLLTKFIIFNPQIGSFLFVQTPLPDISLSTVVACLGFDDTTLDYKILLAKYKPNHHVYLYSSSPGSWRLISCQNIWYSSPPLWTRNVSAIFVKGCFHWIAWRFPGPSSEDNPPFIMVFDIKSETFRRILFPECLMGYLSIVPVFGESSFGVAQKVRLSLVHVWLMDQNGSWLKKAEKVWIGKGARRNGAINGQEAQEVVGFMNKDELLIAFHRGGTMTKTIEEKEVEIGSIVSQNIKRKRKRPFHNVMSTEKRGYYRLVVHAHVPSLVLLDKMMA